MSEEHTKEQPERIWTVGGSSGHFFTRRGNFAQVEYVRADLVSPQERTTASVCISERLADAINDYFNKKDVSFFHGQSTLDEKRWLFDRIAVLFAAPPSTQPSARVAAEEVMRCVLGFNEFDDLAQLSPENGNCRFVTEEVAAIISRHFPVQPVEEQNRPKIICLCGSTRFIEQFAIQTWELERQGFIVLGCTLLPMWYCKVPSHFGEATGTKEQCDELHLRKIDLADQVVVLNIGGYIGESTAREIAYATALGKPVHYLESVAADSVGEEGK